VIVQLSPTKIFPEKLSVNVFPAANPAKVPLPLASNAPFANVVNVNVPLSWPPAVTVPGRLILVTKLIPLTMVVRVAVPLNVAPVWLGILTDAEKPKVPLFWGCWQLDWVRLPLPL
jgi:hypothetical protein